MECLHVLRGHSKPVSQMRIAHGRLYTAAGGAIRVWDTASLRLLDRIQTSLYSGGIRSLLVRGHALTRCYSFCSQSSLIVYSFDFAFLLVRSAHRQ
jgi:hypothetical protein